MRIVFMGTPDFAIPSLEALYDSSHELVKVVSNIDKRRGRGNKLIPTPVKKRALELGLPVLEVDSLSDDTFYNHLKELDADLYVVVAFRILPDRILELPSIGSINLHASLLPRYRGAAPIHWAVINGEETTGCTVFFLDSGVDTGEIIAQRETEIGPLETTGDVYNRLKDMGANLLVDAVDTIADGSCETMLQDDKQATPAPKLYSEDTRLSFDRPAQEVHNKIRGLSPFPTAWTMINGERLNIYRSSIGPDLAMYPGEMRVVEQQLVVGCAQGTVVLEEVQLAGRRRMSGFDFANGYSDSLVIDDASKKA